MEELNAAGSIALTPDSCAGRPSARPRCRAGRGRLLGRVHQLPQCLIGAAAELLPVECLERVDLRARRRPRSRAGAGRPAHQRSYAARSLATSSGCSVDDVLRLAGVGLEVVELGVVDQRDSGRPGSSTWCTSPAPPCPCGQRPTWVTRMRSGHSAFGSFRRGIRLRPSTCLRTSSESVAPAISARVGKMSMWAGQRRRRPTPPENPAGHRQNDGTRVPPW